MSEDRRHDDGTAPFTAVQLRELRRKLADGQITPDEARAMGFPPADPIKEKR